MYTPTKTTLYLVKLADQDIITLEIHEVQDVQGSTSEEANTSSATVVEVNNSEKNQPIQNAIQASQPTPQPAQQQPQQTQQAASSTPPSTTVMTGKFSNQN